MSKSGYESVLEFYKAFQQKEFIASRPGLDQQNISDERLSLKMKLIAEEFFELLNAVYGGASAKIMEDAWAIAQMEDEGNRDIIETADACADLRYVIHGLEIESGIPGDKVFNEVQRSNMSKLGPDGKPIISDGVTPSEYDGQVKPVGKILKPKTFSEPDITGVLGLDK